jgi:hypothetical protein
MLQNLSPEIEKFTLNSWLIISNKSTTTHISNYETIEKLLKTTRRKKQIIYRRRREDEDWYQISLK